MRLLGISVASALALTFCFAGWAAAAGPSKDTFEIPPYTLADALADYNTFGDHAYDCGDFAVVSTFTGSVTVSVFESRMLRQVSYEGLLYNASDTSNSVAYSGRTATWREFNEATDLVAITIHGPQSLITLPDGRHLPDSGILLIDFTTDPPTDTFSHGASVDIDLLCAALA